MFVTASREESWHRRARRGRAEARTLVRLGRAANLISGHHSAQRSARCEMGWEWKKAPGARAPRRNQWCWCAKCEYWEWTRKLAKAGGACPKCGAKLCEAEVGGGGGGQQQGARGGAKGGAAPAAGLTEGSTPSTKERLERYHDLCAKSGESASLAGFQSWVSAGCREAAAVVPNGKVSAQIQVLEDRLLKLRAEGRKKTVAALQAEERAADLRRQAEEHAQRAISIKAEGATVAIDIAHVEDEKAELLNKAFHSCSQIRNMIKS